VVVRGVIDNTEKKLLYKDSLNVPVEMVAAPIMDSKLGQETFHIN
jgi:hypothetical protein